LAGCAGSRRCSVGTARRSAVASWIPPYPYRVQVRREVLASISMAYRLPAAESSGRSDAARSPVRHRVPVPAGGGLLVAAAPEVPAVVVPAVVVPAEVGVAVGLPGVVVSCPAGERVVAAPPSAAWPATVRSAHPAASTPAAAMATTAALTASSRVGAVPGT